MQFFIAIKPPYRHVLMALGVSIFLISEFLHDVQAMR